MEWWIIAIVLAVVALLIVGPVSLIAFAIYGIRYLRGDDHCEKTAGRWLKVFACWLVPLIGMTFVGMGSDYHRCLSGEPSMPWCRMSVQGSPR